MLQELQPNDFKDFLRATSEASAPYKKTGAVDEHQSNLQLVLEGGVLRQRLLSNGRQQNVGVYFRDDVINLELYATGQVRDTDHLLALEGTVIGSIPYYAVSTMSNHESTFGSIGKLVYRELAIARERLLSLGQRTSIEAMAHFFCETTLRCAQPAPEADHCLFPMSQQTLSTVLGISPVHANRTLQNLRLRGLAEIVNRELIVHDFEGLAILADFSGDYLSDL